jgi:hypothetical protein
LRHSKLARNISEMKNAAGDPANMDKVRHHFEEEAKEFDRIILTLIPYYGAMIPMDKKVAELLKSEYLSRLGSGNGDVEEGVCYDSTISRNR